MGLIILPKEPKSGDPVRALDVAALIRYVRSITPRTSRDVRPNISTDGTTFDIISASRKGSKPKPFDLVPALLLPGYQERDDGKDFRRYYVRWGLLNGTPVSGTLQQDGSIGDDSTLIEVPDDATKFIVWIGVGASIEPGDYNTGGWPCTLKFEFTSAGPSGESVPTIFSGKDGWTEYPFQPPALRGVDISGYNGYCTDPYLSITQTCYCPIAIITKEPDTGRLVVEQNVDHHLDLVLTYLGGAGNADHPPPVVPTFSFSTRVEDITGKTPTADEPCAGDCETPEPGEQGGGNDVPGSTDALNPFTFDQKARLAGNWLYRVYRPAQGTGIAYDVDNWKTVAMQDGWLWKGGDSPNVVSWGGAVLSGGETEGNPYIIALKVVFSNLTGIGGAPTFTPSIAHGVGITTDADLNTESKTPDGWPTGYTVEELDNGTIYLPIAHVFFKGQKMIIKEIHRDQASLLLELLGGDDGATTSEGVEVPMHHIALVCGRVQKEIATTGLLDDTAFTLKQVVGDMQVTLDSSASPTLHYKVQKKMMSQCYYRGWLAYQKLDVDWTDPSQTIDGWSCDSEE